MDNAKYYYNSKTCQYERARVNPGGALVYVLGVLLTSMLFLSGLIILNDYLVVTDNERALRQENKMLSEHKKVLSQQLASINQTLDTLKAADRRFYTELFSTAPEEPMGNHATISKEQILLADASGFTAWLDVVRNSSSRLLEQSSRSNAAFSDAIHIDKNDLDFIRSIPSASPIAHLELDKLVSGFGKRINPFHKGMYKHEGIDFAAARGTEVLAAADGQVVVANSSSLQAGYGSIIEINHGNGFSTRYAHLENVHVNRGQKVTKGMVIGTVGNSGGSVAPHLHYEIVRDKESVDPALYIIEGLSGRQHYQLLELSKKQNQALD